jgi:hypothetical protein
LPTKIPNPESVEKQTASRKPETEVKGQKDR